nr:putative reverse transcriptase domain-containing protein [Tanacetum cinerariifolium]
MASWDWIILRGRGAGAHGGVKEWIWYGSGTGKRGRRYVNSVWFGRQNSLCGFHGLEEPGVQAILRQVFIMFIDDILIYSKSKEDHEVQLKLVLELLKKEKKERVKPRRVRAMAMTIQSGVKRMILAAQSEVLKEENAPKERLHGLTKSAYFLAIREDYQMEKLARLYNDKTVAGHGVPVLIFLGSRWTIYITILANIIERLRDAIGYEYGLSSSDGWTKLIGPELVQETTDKVVLIREKLKVTRDRQKSYADNRRKPLEFEVRDQVLLKVLPWKGVIRFRKKGKLAPSMHNTFHVSNLKKCLADANLHKPLDEINVDKTLRFVEEPVEIIDREVKSLKLSKISIVKLNFETKFPKEGDTVTTVTLSRLV